jgi:Ca2+-binding RTX toxin-like protein
VTVPTGGAATLAVSGGALTFATPDAQDCGAATVTNTDSIRVVGNAGTTESLTLDETGGAFTPGAAVETGTGALSEIEISVQLGDAADGLAILGTSGDDSIAVGTNGVALNGDSDVDVTFSVLPAEMTARGNGGVNTLTGRGGTGAGTVFPGRVIFYAGDNGDTLRGGDANDDLRGGAGNDTIEGRGGNDNLVGGGGNDSLAGGTENDTMVGGAGSDTFAGSDGDDTMRADDDFADAAISGGAGVDTAYYDVGIDPNPGAVENKIPSSPAAT